MLNRIKKYLEHKRNMKIVKRELAVIGATFLPLISNAGNVAVTIISFVTKMSNELNGIGGEKFFELLLDELSKTLQTDNERLIEILSYVSQLSPKEVHSIITDAIINTSNKS